MNTKNNFKAIEHIFILVIFLFAIKTSAEKPSFSIYPNPSNQNITISYNATNNYKIVITNILGAIVYEKEMAANQDNNTVIDLKGLQIVSGVYLVKIEAKNEQTSVQKLIYRP